MPLEVLHHHLDHFRATGRLPEDQRLAVAVAERVDRGWDAYTKPDGTPDYNRTVRLSLHVPDRKPDPVMDGLLYEAVHRVGIPRAFARTALVALANLGVDVTATPFADAYLALPEYGTIGGWILGWPERLACPPFADQGRRLIARMEALQPKLGSKPHRWFVALDDYTDDFFTRGTLPDEPLAAEAVLITGETRLLLEHSTGRDVAAELAAFDAAVRDSAKGGRATFEALGMTLAAASR